MLSHERVWVVFVHNGS